MCSHRQVNDFIPPSARLEIQPKANNQAEVIWLGFNAVLHAHQQQGSGGERHILRGWRGGWLRCRVRGRGGRSCRRSNWRKAGTGEGQGDEIAGGQYLHISECLETDSCCRAAYVFSIQDCAILQLENIRPDVGPIPSSRARK
jgi:hypothetical protein